MLDLLWKRAWQAGLRMLFHNTALLGKQAQPGFFPPKFQGETSQGHLLSKISDGVLESRASSLAKGFESTAPAWLAQAQPCVSLPFFYPCLSCPSVVPPPLDCPSVALRFSALYFIGVYLGI
jgi:hypothetical protein